VTVWIVTYTYNDYDGDSNRFVDVAASKEAALLSAQEDAKKQFRATPDELRITEDGSRVEYGTLHEWVLLEFEVRPDAQTAPDEHPMTGAL
jgi:hypothetical protein